MVVCVGLVVATCAFAGVVLARSQGAIVRFRVLPVNYVFQNGDGGVYLRLGVTRTKPFAGRIEDFLIGSKDATYESSSPDFKVSDSGLLTTSPGATGSVGTITVSLKERPDLKSEVIAYVDNASHLLKLEPAEKEVRMKPGANQELEIDGVFSNGTQDEIQTAEGTHFQSSDDSIVSVDRFGRLTAHKQGTAAINVSYKGLKTTVQAVVSSN